MARGGINKAKMLMLLRGAKQEESGLGKLSGTTTQRPAAERFGVSKSSGKMKDSAACWVPHPRTGIYFPKGHEWVMDDVPEGAACFDQTYWFRNVDGVDNANTKA